MTSQVTLVFTLYHRQTSISYRQMLVNESSIGQAPSTPYSLRMSSVVQGEKLQNRMKADKCFCISLYSSRHSVLYYLYLHSSRTDGHSTRGGPLLLRTKQRLSPSHSLLSGARSCSARSPCAEVPSAKTTTQSWRQPWRVMSTRTTTGSRAAATCPMRRPRGA